MKSVGYLNLREITNLITRSGMTFLIISVKSAFHQRLGMLLLLLLCSSLMAEPFPLFYTEARPFREVCEAAEAKLKPLPQRITGVTVPHHLLAVDLIAETLFLASAGKYERIVILSPDHFKRGTTPFSTTTRDFLTPLGRLRVDTAAVKALMQEPLVSESSLFSREHGVQAVLPLLAGWFPESLLLTFAEQRGEHEGYEGEPVHSGESRSQTLLRSMPARRRLIRSARQVRLLQPHRRDACLARGSLGRSHARLR